MTTLEIYKLGVTASDEWRCRQCGYAGRLITHDCYKGAFSSVRTYRGGFLRCPNPWCRMQGEFMNRQSFDRVARFYEWDPRYDQAEIDAEASRHNAVCWQGGEWPEPESLSCRLWCQRSFRSQVQLDGLTAVKEFGRPQDIIPESGSGRHPDSVPLLVGFRSTRTKGSVRCTLAAICTTSASALPVRIGASLSAAVSDLPRRSTVLVAAACASSAGANASQVRTRRPHWDRSGPGRRPPAPAQAVLSRGPRSWANAPRCSARPLPWPAPPAR